MSITLSILWHDGGTYTWFGFPQQSGEIRASYFPSFFVLDNFLTKKHSLSTNKYSLLNWNVEYTNITIGCAPNHYPSDTRGEAIKDYIIIWHVKELAKWLMGIADKTLRPSYICINELFKSSFQNLWYTLILIKLVICMESIGGLHWHSVMYAARTYHIYFVYMHMGSILSVKTSPPVFPLDYSPYHFILYTWLSLKNTGFALFRLLLDMHACDMLFLHDFQFQRSQSCYPCTQKRYR